MCANRNSIASWLLVAGLLSAAPAAAQTSLDENCTVSILNRTARVTPDGSFALPNVPANFGRVRARATCRSENTTISGQSPFFVIPTAGAVDVPAIDFSQVDPVPVFLTLTAPKSQLTAIGETTQLSVVGTLPNTSTIDLTASTGTNYRSSNPALATVSESGQLTAVASGLVIVNAMYEGVVGSILFEIALSADSDGDGIPDEDEIRLGLDPNNPADALQDIDEDGLTNLDEFRLGTDLRSADGDSDGDGIPDAEEVVAGNDGFVTNPLLADSDGDGVRDKLEIDSGTDPTDPNSFDIAAALVSFSVFPTALNLSGSAADGETSAQLSVTGLLTDGFEIDLTPASKGTTYTSSDTNICSFGATAGEVFAGQNGACTVTVALGAFSVDVPVNVTSFNPTALSRFSAPGAEGVAVQGNTVYVAAGLLGLSAIDVTDRSAPVRIGGPLALPGFARRIQVQGDTAYLASRSAGLQVVDVSDPANPTVIGSSNDPKDAYELVVEGAVAFVASRTSGLHIFDISSPANPFQIANVPLAGIARGVAVDPLRRLLFVATDQGITAVDITTPGVPQVVGELPDATGFVDIGTNGTALYAPFNGQFNVGPVATVDASAPSAMQLLGTLDPSLAGRLNEIVVVNDLAFGSDTNFVNGVPIIAVDDPPNPAPRAIINFSQYGDHNGAGVAADQAFVYLVAADGSQHDLFVGQYRQITDNANIPPAVSIVAPIQGQNVVEGALVTVRTQATDDVAVERVELRLDGNLVAIDRTAPFIFNARTPEGAAQFSLQARAFDFGGNMADSNVVSVNLGPDNVPPQVRIGRVLPGLVVDQFRQLTVQVLAADDVGVASIELFKNGQTAGIVVDAAAATFQTSADTAPAVSLTARVLDRSGNSADSAPVDIQIVPDAPPVVSFVVPAEGAALIEGQEASVLAEVTDDRRVNYGRLYVNGTGPGNIVYERNFVPFGGPGARQLFVQLSVPYGLDRLELIAEGIDDSNQVTRQTLDLSVVPDPGSNVIGQTVLGSPGFPGLGGVNVILGFQGLSAEFFSLPGPLLDWPDIASLTPAGARVAQVPNLAGAGVNPYAIETAPGTPIEAPYLIRYRGWLTMDAIGTLDFSVFNGRDSGSPCAPGDGGCVPVPPEQPVRLTINGECAFDTFGDAGFTPNDCGESVYALPGLVPVEILWAKNDSSDRGFELRTTLTGSTNMTDDDRESSRDNVLGSLGFIQARSSDFLPDVEVFHQTSSSGANTGEFSFLNVPTVHQRFTNPIFQEIAARTDFAEPIQRRAFTVRQMVRGGTTDVGNLFMNFESNVGPTNGGFEEGYPGAKIFLAGGAEQISEPFFGITPFEGGSMVLLKSKHRILYFNSFYEDLGIDPATSLSTHPFLVDGRAGNTIRFSYRLFVNKDDLLDTKLVARLISQADNAAHTCCETFPLEISEADALLAAPPGSGYTHMTDWRQAVLTIGANGQTDVRGTGQPLVLQIMPDADFTRLFNDDPDFGPEDPEALQALDGAMSVLIDSITIQ